MFLSEYNLKHDFYVFIPYVCFTLLLCCWLTIGFVLILAEDDYKKWSKHWYFINLYLCVFYIVLCLIIFFSYLITLLYLILDANGPTIVTTIVPLGPGPTHTICPHCHAEIDTSTKTEPGMIAYISGVIIALLGYNYKEYSDYTLHHAYVYSWMKSFFFPSY